ncbi:MAG: Thermophilic metalloprotease superfamily, partial [Patescibacteria group bacterium]|nr:Thermophilic metalloprotease superfamily [Patescibacteria group bacterium]
MAYIPPQEILLKYADVLVNFALGGGGGVKPGEAVWMRLHESAKPMYVPLRNAILKAGANPIIQYIADDVRVSDEYELSSDKQLSFFPGTYMKGLVDQVDHMLYLYSEYDKYELKEVDPKKIMARSNALRPYMEWRNEKEAAGKFTWTLAIYGTPAMAKEANMSEEEYWQEIIKACYLDMPDPISEWKKTFAELERIQGELNALSIESLHVQAEDIDLKVGIGPNRKWLGGMGRNIPSFELFISPDCRKTEGTIHFNQPLYRYGNMIEDISLTFKDGKVVDAKAAKGEELLKEMISSENANMIGEFSLTDGRFSRITKVMADTLYDENIGGPQGNTHVAVGNAYQDSYPGDASTVTPE